MMSFAAWVFVLCASSELGARVRRATVPLLTCARMTLQHVGNTRTNDTRTDERSLLRLTLRDCDKNKIRLAKTGPPLARGAQRQTLCQKDETALHEVRLKLND